jgi:hypothetical protein
MMIENEKSTPSASQPQPSLGKTPEGSDSFPNSSHNSNPSFVQFLIRLIVLLYETISSQESKIEALTKENAELAQKLNEPKKDSENSSSKPSSDPYKKKKPPLLDENGQPIKGKPGAKKGHKAYHRKKYKTKKKDPKEGGAPLELPDQDIPTKEVEILPDSTVCPICETEMVSCPDKDRLKEQIELVDNPLIRIIYKIKAFQCGKCGKVHYGTEPATLGTGLIGPSLLALLIFLKGVGHMSFTSLQRFLSVFGLKVCRGFICESVSMVTAALEKVYTELKEALPKQKVVNTDETGHKERGKKMWTWVFRAKTFAFFAIRDNRATTVITDILGKSFKGIIGCDCYSAYKKFLRLFPNVKAQLCLAHFKRDIQYLIDHLDNPILSEFGTKIMNILVELFQQNKLWRKLRRPRDPDDPDDPDLQGEAREAKADEVLEYMRQLVKRLKEVALDPPNIKKAKNIANRFIKWPEDSYFMFLSDEGIELELDPMNNVAEQTVRFVVIDRHVTQGTRSLNGRMRSERVWSVIATCAIQGISAFDFIRDSIKAHYCKDREYPSFFDKAE